MFACSHLFGSHFEHIKRNTEKMSDFNKISVQSWHYLSKLHEIIYLNINQTDALNIIMSSFHASTSFEHMCSSSGGQNCTIQPLVTSHWNKWVFFFSKITKITKITKIEFYKYEHIVYYVFILLHLVGFLQPRITIHRTTNVKLCSVWLKNDQGTWVISL